MTDLLGELAQEHLEVLAGEIGPRPAGSASLQKAQEYVRGMLEGWGYRVADHPVQFSRRPWLRLLYPAAGALLVGAGLLFQQLPVLAVGMPLVGAALPQLSRWLIRRSRLEEKSHNLFAQPPGGKPAQVLLLCAHLDTAPALPYQHPFLIRLHAQRLAFYQRAAVAVALFALFPLLGLPLVAWAGSLLAGVCFLAGGWMILSEMLDGLRQQPAYSPGANDNASGAAVLLTLAAYFSHHPLQNMEVNFLFTDAEETGLDGARAAAGRLDPDRMLVINVDQVGAGTGLGLIAREGTLRVRRTDRQLNAVLREVDPGITDLHHTRRSGDYRPFLLAGFRVTSLEGDSLSAARWTYHTLNDRPETVDSRALEKAVGVLIKTAEKLDQVYTNENSLLSHQRGSG
jgi:hypothetical protein